MPVKIKSTGGGSISLDVPNTGTDYTLTMPAKTGNIITSADANTVSSSMLAANSVTATQIAASSISASKMAANTFAWELITSYTVTAGTQITLDNIFTTTYDYYHIFVTGLTATTNDFNTGADAAIRFIDSTGTVLTSSLYATNEYWARSNEVFNNTTGTNVDHGAFSRRFPSASGSRGYDGEWKIHRPMDANIGKRMFVSGGQDSYDDTITTSVGSTGYRGKVAVRGLYIFTNGDSGGWSGGYIRVYGLRAG